MKKPKKLSIKKLFSSPCNKCSSTRQNKNAPQSPAATVASSVASPKMAGESPTVPTVLWSPAKENGSSASIDEHEIIRKEIKQEQQEEQQQQHHNNNMNKNKNNKNKNKNKNNDSSFATDDASSTDSLQATAISLRRTNSGDTADLTVHSNTPPRDLEDDLVEGFLSTPSSLASSNTNSSSSSSSNTNTRNPYIFSDEDEDEDGDTSKNADDEQEQEEQEQEQEQTTTPPPAAAAAETETEAEAEAETETDAKAQCTSPRAHAKLQRKEIQEHNKNHSIL